MQEQRFTEKDWKLFRSKVADWQESYMDRLNREYINLIHNIISLPHEGAISFDDIEDFSDGLKETVGIVWSK